MRKILLLLGIITASLLILGCGGGGNDTTTNDDAGNPSDLPDVASDNSLEDTESEADNATLNTTLVLDQKPTCTVTADCSAGTQCNDGVCGTIDDLYSFDCNNKCNYNNVLVTTSDGESYTLARGQGSYTSAGALEWRLLAGPDYCPDENVPVPIKIIKKNTGKVVSEEVLVLHQSETSKVITHPTIKRIAFTATLEELEETCNK